MKFNAPPNWPQPPSGWTPPPNWYPAPVWGPAPEGWQFWVEDARPAASPLTARKKKRKTSSFLTRLKKIWSSALSSDSRHWIFGGMGLIAGLLLGVVVGAGASSPVTTAASSSGITPDADSADVGFGSTPIETAVGECGLTDATGISVGDEGHSVAIQTTGDENAYGADVFEMFCILQGLDASDSVVARMDNTRALDGRQTGTWDDFEASWGYHPDDGINLIIEEVK